MRDRKREIVRENAKEPHNKERLSGKTYIMAISTSFPPRMNISNSVLATLQACKHHLHKHSSLEVFITGCLVSEISENLKIPQRNT